jgi:Predicted permease
VFRPIAGVATAIAAGLATNLFGAPRVTEPPLEVAKTPAAGDERCQHACDPAGHDHAHRHDHYDPPVQQANSLPDRGAGRTIFDTTRRIIRYGFVELLDDVSWWLALGIVLSAVVVFAIPAQLFEGMWGGGIASMVLMLVLSIPLYTCASCSTPMAAALALKGLSPGAVLVFLLAGPATNIGSLVVLLKVLGRCAVAAYLVAVAIMTLAAGFALNAIYHAWGLDPRLTFGTAAGFVPDLVKEAGAVLLTGLVVLSMFRTHVPNEWIWVRDRAAQLTGIAVSPRGLGFAAAAGAAVLWLGSGFFTVGPGETGIRLRFGRILASDLEPGLHFRLPWPFEKHQLIAQNLARRLEFGLPRELSREEATRAQLRGRPAF